MVKFEDAIKQSREYFDDDDLAANVFVTKYALTDKDGGIHEATPDDMHRRLSNSLPA